MENTKLHKIIDGKNIYYDSKLDKIFEEFIEVNNNDRTNVSYPRDLCIEITNRCNFLCKNCFSQKSANFLTLSKIKKYVKYYENRIIRICLTGGEPFLNPEINDIIYYLNGFGNIGKVINTTGFFLDNSIIYDLLKKWTVAISLHGRPEIHNEYVGVDSYNKIVNSLDLLCKKHINTHIYSVIHNNFEEKDIFHLIELKNKFNVSDLRLIKIRNSGVYQNINDNILVKIPENIKNDIFYKAQKSNTLFISTEEEVRLTN